MSRTIRRLSLPEVEMLVGWAAAEGWNPGIGDAAAFHATDPGGFLGAFVDGEMAAGVSAVRYGTTFGFIGLYICRPEWRGQGHGRAVWDAAMVQLKGRTVGLDGVPAQQASYASMGFVYAYETVRMTGLPPAAATADIRPVATPHQIVTLDRQCFPADRGAFLAAWLSPPRIALAAYANGALAGYGVVRPCPDGHKLGPLFAASEEAAAALLAALANAAGGPVQIDVPVRQENFLVALKGAGMTPGFSTARMYLGPPPVVAEDQVFGTSTLELG